MINIWYLDVTGFGILNLGYLTSYINILAVDQPDETQSLPVAVIAGATAAAVVIAVVAVLAVVVLRRFFNNNDSFEILNQSFISLAKCICF